MKKLSLLFMVCCTMVLLAFATAASAQPQAICVPWQPSSPSIAHYTYSGAEITLKGIARGSSTTYTWDFGDGSLFFSDSITDPHNLGVKHTYVGISGQKFTARLTVSDGTDTHQDTYPVKIYESSDLSDPDHLDVRINMAIDEGLWYLHTNMIRAIYASGSPGYAQSYGFWSDAYSVAATGTAVDAFQLHGSKANTDYEKDPYVETVQRALNYLLYNTHSFAIGVQSAGDPDVNDNGIGLVTNQSASATDYRQTYVGGICMVALASSGASNKVAAVGGADVYARTYADIVQDMVDFWAWGQVESSSSYHRGGWRYYANYGESDMSTTQWPPLGMLAAEHNMGSIVPQFVYDELTLYINALQNTALNNDNGCFGYMSPTQLPNITKAAAGIICHEFLGTPLTDRRVESAIGFVYRHWNDTGTSWDYTKLHGNSYGMYGLMKAFRIPEPDLGYNDVTGHSEVKEYDYNAGSQTGNIFEWYYTPSGQANEGLASHIVSTQQADGSWDDTVGSNRVYDAFCSGWRILVLLKGVTIIPPEAVICDCDEQEYNLNQDIHLDGSCSFHPKLTRTIVLYDWDLDNDGIYDTTGVETIIAGGFPAEGHYPVILRVTDDNPNNLGGPQTDTYMCDIWVHPPPHCPHAFAGGPYIGWVGTPVTLDASTSWDPDNEIESYEWDLDYDGLFGDEDDDCFGEPSDAVGINPEWTWNEPYSGVIALRVTDAEGEFESCPDTDYTTVEIGNHAPKSDPGGAYTASAEFCIVLDGTGSSDPDPGDTISYAWDLDNDGDFDDCSEAECEFCVGADIGTVYDICLKVTDSFGKYDISCTTVTIVPNQPPDCSEAYSSIQEIWPPNHKYVDIEIMGVTDPDGDPVTITITGITQDEPVDAVSNGDGKTSPDGTGVGSGTACVRAERQGTGNGRVYEISFTATDPAEAKCSGSVTVCVPHDQGPDHECVDDGQDYDSTTEE